MSQLLVQRLVPTARLPTRNCALDAGLDLYALREARIDPGGRTLVETGIAVAVPPGHYGRVAPRSGLAARYGVDIGAGVIDGNYTGPLNVLMFNFGSNPYYIRPGDRIAQLILEKMSIAEVKEVEALSVTARGDKGFGSSGM